MTVCVGIDGRVWSGIGGRFQAEYPAKDGEAKKRMNQSMSGGYMHLQYRQLRLNLLNFCLGFIPDLAIAFLVAKYINDKGFDYWTFFLVIVGLQIVYFLIWLKSCIWQWICFAIYNRYAYSELIAGYIMSNNFPVPKFLVDDVEDYMIDVADNEDNPFELRLKAAAEVAIMKFLAQQGQYMNLWRLKIIYKDALLSLRRH